MLNEKKLHQMIEMQKTEQGLKKQKGASMIEYALVLAAVVAVGATFFGTNGDITTAINTKLSGIANNL
uniref:Flp/Fap (Type IV) pilin component n=1 Tax=Hydrogenovibrio crunogenus (strain DSM 25203 / XCL-2) TaxID=317025 RepID=Q31EV1_HYDCU